MSGRLHDGRVEMDSNFVENQIRPIKLTAKNARFAGHPNSRIDELLPWSFKPPSS